VTELQVQLLHPDAQPPARTRPGDAGFDLCCVEAFALAPGERAVVGTGVAVALPDGVAGLVVPRSGLAARHGLSVVNGPGLVDPTYRGEIRVVLVNLGAEHYQGEAGDRVAQLLLVPFVAPATRLVEALPPSSDERGASGFGSSGR
jgi:dUTP pyrophosphatase